MLGAPQTLAGPPLLGSWAWTSMAWTEQPDCARQPLGTEVRCPGDTSGVASVIMNVLGAPLIYLSLGPTTRHRN